MPSSAGSSSVGSPLSVERGTGTASICDDEHAIAAAETPHELSRFLFRRLEPRRLHVDGLHRRAGVDQDHEVAPLADRGRRARIAEREEQQREQRELEQAARASA